MGAAIAVVTMARICCEQQLSRLAKGCGLTSLLISIWGLVYFA